VETPTHTGKHSHTAGLPPGLHGTQQKRL